MSIPASYTNYWNTFWSNYNSLLSIIRGLHLEAWSGLNYYDEQIDSLQYIMANDLYIYDLRLQGYLTTFVDRLQGFTRAAWGELSQTLLVWIDNFKGVFDTYLETSFSYLDAAVDLINSYYQQQIDGLNTGLANTAHNLYLYIDAEIDQVYVDLNSIVAEVYTAISQAQTAAEEYASDLVDNVYTYYDNEIDELYSYINGQVAELTGQIQEGQGVSKSYVDNLVDTARADLTAAIDTLEGLVGVQLASIYNDLQAMSASINQDLDLGLTTVNNRISAEILTVNGSIQSVADQVAAQYQRVTDEREAAIDGLREEVGVNMLAMATDLALQIQHVQDDFEAQMAVTSDLSLYALLYSQGGLDRPEIGLLQMINKDDAQFNRYRSYWRLLLARVLATTPITPP